MLIWQGVVYQTIEWYWGANIAVLEIKTIQIAEKQKQCLSENGKSLKKKKKTVKKLKWWEKNDGIPPFGGKRSCPKY